MQYSKLDMMEKEHRSRMASIRRATKNPTIIEQKRLIIDILQELDISTSGKGSVTARGIAEKLSIDRTLIHRRLLQLYREGKIKVAKRKFEYSKPPSNFWQIKKENTSNADIEN